MMTIAGGPFESYLRTFADRGFDPQRPCDVTVIMPTVMRKTITDALKSVFRQDLAGRIQVLIGIDHPGDDIGLQHVWQRGQRLWRIAPCAHPSKFIAFQLDPHRFCFKPGIEVTANRVELEQTLCLAKHEDRLGCGGRGLPPCHLLEPQG